MKFHLVMNQGKYMINITEEILWAFKPIAHEKTDPFFQEIIDTNWVYKLFNNEPHTNEEILRVKKSENDKYIMPLIDNAPLVEGSEIFIAKIPLECHVYLDEIFKQNNSKHREYLNERLIIKIRDSLDRQLQTKIKLSIVNHYKLITPLTGWEELEEISKSMEGYLVLHPKDYGNFKFPNGQTGKDFMHYKRSDVRKDFIVNEDQVDILKTQIYGTFHKTKIMVSTTMVEKNMPLLFHNNSGKMYSFGLGNFYLTNEIVDHKLRFVITAFMNTGMYLNPNNIHKVWV